MTYPTQMIRKEKVLQFHIVDHLHGEHELKGYYLAHISNVFDGREADNYFRTYFESTGLENTILNKKVDSALTLVYNKSCKHLLIESDNDTQDGRYATVICISISEDRLEEWLFLLEGDIESAIINSSGDSDFFDYMPNFVNIFRQVCILVAQPERYNNLLKKVGPVHTEIDEEYEFYHESA